MILKNLFLDASFCFFLFLVCCSPPTRISLVDRYKVCIKIIFLLHRNWFSMLSLLILVSITFTLTAPKPITPQPINKSTSPPSHAQIKYFQFSLPVESQTTSGLLERLSNNEFRIFTESQFLPIHIFYEFKSFRNSLKTNNLKNVTISKNSQFPKINNFHKFKIFFVIFLRIRKSISQLSRL